jgi:CopG family transcriptional regulator, nickel-responsive regulator
MQRVTITLDDHLMDALDGYMRAGGHANRSEAIRDLVRIGLDKRETGVAAEKTCVGALVYVYDHETRRLAERLTTEQHVHHDLSVATLHVHLDEHKCMEVAVLKGSTHEVRHFADHVIGERGIQYGQLVTIPVAGGAVAAPARVHSHPSGARPTVARRDAKARGK